MSRIIDKIKGFVHSLASMFEEDDEIEEESLLDPDTEKGQEFAKVMRPVIEEINRRAEEREKEQMALAERLKNQREDNSSKSQDSDSISNSLKVNRVTRQTRVITRQRVQESRENEERDEIE